MRHDEFNLFLTCDAGDEHADFLDAHLRRAWTLVDGAPRVVSVAVVDDATMADLHERFLNIAGPTDVLTFEMGDDEGEIVICLDEARRQSADRGTTVGQELLLYAIHGLLHLAGRDDLTQEGYDAMHAEEDDILTRIGVGTVFGRGGTCP